LVRFRFMMQTKLTVVAYREVQLSGQS
jgi:hypothetical protein